MPNNPINNRYRVDYIHKQLKIQLKNEYKGTTYEDALLDNLSMLFFLRKKYFSYMEFLKNIHVRKEYDDRLDKQGSPLSFIHEAVVHSAILHAYMIIGRDSGVDFGSIFTFAKKNWGADTKWRSRLSPSKEHEKIRARTFDLRNKLIAHTDINLQQVITERDIKKLIKLYDEYVVKRVSRIFVKFLGHNQAGSLDFEDMSVQTYVLLYPRS